MLALVCNNCDVIYMTEKDTKLCVNCTELAQHQQHQRFLAEYVDRQLEESRKFIMEFIGNPKESRSYQFHLGQAAALQDIKNLLYVQSV